MKLLKKIAVTAVMAASMLAVSSTAFAAEGKDLNKTIREAGENTEASLMDAEKLLKEGGDTSEQIKADLNNARQSIKEFRYEATERLRQKMNEKIKTAREAFLKNDNAKTLEDVTAALKIYSEMKVIYAAGH